MNDRVKAILDSRMIEDREKYEKKKTQTLFELELFDKLYAPDDKWSEEYPLSEWSNEEQKTKYYKSVPIQITDEDFEDLKREINKRKGNIVAKILKNIAICYYVVGFIIGFIVLGEHGPVLAGAFWGASFVSGLMLHGFSEVIRLLEEINNK